jgi:hypothetical protein
MCRGAGLPAGVPRVAGGLPVLTYLLMQVGSSLGVGVGEVMLNLRKGSKVPKGPEGRRGPRPTVATPQGGRGATRARQGQRGARLLG